MSIFLSNSYTSIQFLKFDVANIWNLLILLSHDYKPRPKSVMYSFFCRKQRKITFSLCSGHCSHIPFVIHFKRPRFRLSNYSERSFASNGHHRYFDHKGSNWSILWFLVVLNNEPTGWDYFHINKFIFFLYANLISLSTWETVSKLMLRVKNTIEFDLVTEKSLIQAGPSFWLQSLRKAYDFL